VPCFGFPSRVTDGWKGAVRSQTGSLNHVMYF
jgi:hypothetical protein